MPLGTSMDFESEDSRSKGCWDPASILTPFYEKWTSISATPDFVIDDVWCGMVASLGFGSGVKAETVDFWKQTVKDVYRGDEGRKKARMALICLLERDGLLLRLRDIKCPVYWLQVSCYIAPAFFVQSRFELSFCLFQPISSRSCRILCFRQSVPARYLLTSATGNGRCSLRPKSSSRTYQTLHFFK